MEGEDPSPSGAKTQLGDPGDLDTAPVLTTRNNLDYLVELINAEWRKTMVKYTYSTCAPEKLAPSFNELQDIDIYEDTITKVNNATIGQLAMDVLMGLGRMDRRGNPLLMDLIKLVEEDLAKDPFSTSSASKKIEDGMDKTFVFAGILKELASNRMLGEMGSKKAPRKRFQTLVIFMDQSGAMRLKPCLFQHDTDFASFLELMESCPQGHDQYAKSATSSWDKAVQQLKEKGYGGNPKLGEIEQQIASFKATNYSAVPRWVFYKTNRRISSAKPVKDDGDVKRFLEILANPPKDNQLDPIVRLCRAVDKEVIVIDDEISFFERSIEDNVQRGKEPVAPAAQRDCGNQSNQQSKQDQGLGSLSDFFGSKTKDWQARNFGAEWGFVEADDEME